MYHSDVVVGMTPKMEEGVASTPLKCGPLGRCSREGKTEVNNFKGMDIETSRGRSEGDCSSSSARNTGAGFYLHSRYRAPSPRDGGRLAEPLKAIKAVNASWLRNLGVNIITVERDGAPNSIAAPQGGAYLGQASRGPNLQDIQSSAFLMMPELRSKRPTIMTKQTCELSGMASLYIGAVQYDLACSPDAAHRPPSRKWIAPLRVHRRLVIR